MLTKTTMIDASEDNIFFIKNKSDLEANRLSVITVPKNDTIVIPAYSSVSLNLYFVMEDDMYQHSQSKQFQISWTYALHEKRLFQHKKLKSYEFRQELSDLYDKQQIELDTAHKLRPQTLAVLTPKNHSFDSTH
jgi:nucleoside-specific outer membrane channel protein Tsx